MRYVAILCAALSTPAFVIAQVYGQATIERGYASTWVAPPGVYALPFVPLVTTPIVEFAPPPLEVGASNATYGNIAGATASTLVIETPSSYPVFAPLPVPGIATFSRTQEVGTTIKEFQTTSLELGAATFQSDYGVAELAANSPPRAHSTKTYTNEDIQSLHQNEQK
ncbi:MAG: hypothetical protein JWO91_2206 [Acidobacteriaceae bacterium]|nr:hypothetical protein [Acidobacteriaceae bacterium]